MTITADFLDDETCALYLQVPTVQVVLLQSYFETYDGLGTVRTIDLKKSLIAILTTPAMLPECLRVLEGLRAEIAWTAVNNITKEERLRYLGYSYIKEEEHAEDHSKIS